MAVRPSGVKETAVMRSGTSVQYATTLSGMDQRRSLQSSEPARKKRSSRGWKEMEVTKSECWKEQRHSERETCQRRTVLSMEEESRKLFYERQRGSPET